ncbi:unnamed protein product [Urochloa decumbens]|uniref:GRF-type domain-containing protein n=1 Tax=Urochloa decumbens TaxID=240449 RepID=A0ABC9CIA9_9POAL
MSQQSFSHWNADPLAQYPIGPSGLPLISCPDCGDRTVEGSSRKNGGKVFFKCINYESHVPGACGFFKWITEYRKVVAARRQQLIGGLVPSCSGANNHPIPSFNGVRHGNLVDGADLKLIVPNLGFEKKMDKLIDLVQFLVVISIGICIVVFFGVVVLLVK